MWVSLDGGFTWGLLMNQSFPLYGGVPASSASTFVRGTGREDPLAALDPSTGYLYTGSGLQRDASGSKKAPQDLYRTSISLHNISALAIAASITTPPQGTGLRTNPSTYMFLSALTLTAPFSPRQQGGLYVVNSIYSGSANPISVTTTAGTSAAAPSSLVVFGGEGPVVTNTSNDIWLTASGTSYSQVVTTTTFNSESYGVATCTDPYKQILYSIGGDLSDDRGGTQAVWASTNLGQNWAQSTAPWPGRSNSLCFVDSQSRLFIIGGKWANASGVAVSNDVWMGVSTSPTASSFTWTQQSASAPFQARDGPGGATYYSTVLQTDVLYVIGGYQYSSQLATSEDDGIGTNGQSNNNNNNTHTHTRATSSHTHTHTHGHAGQ